MFGQQQQQGGGSNKQICSYYLKGTCKYGAKCWNYHPPNQGPGTGGYAGTSTVFGGKSSAQQDSKEFTDFVKQVSGEMNQWERSGQWLASSFTPLKARPLLQGFSDTAPEEFRLQAYTANKTNTYQQYQSNWGEIQQQFRQLREALKLSTPEAVQALKDIFFNKSPLEQQGAQGALKQPGEGLFGKAPASVFGGATSGGGLLGAAPQTSVFATAPPSVFGGAAQTSATPSIFSGGASAAAKPVFGGGQSSVFGGAQSGAVFGGAQSGAVFGGAQSAAAGVFGGTPAQPPASTPGSLFGSPPGQTAPQTPQQVFGGARPNTQPQTATTPVSIFGQQKQQQQSSAGLFGTQPQTQQTGLFGQQHPQQPQQPQQPGLFGAQQQPQPQQQPGLFGTQPQPPQPQQAQSGGLFTSPPPPSTTFPSVFSGGPQQPPISIFGGAQQMGGAQEGKGLFGGASPGSGGWGLKSGVFGGAGEANPKPGLFGRPAEPTPVHGGPAQTPQQAPLLATPQLAPQQAPQQGPRQAQAGHNYTPLDLLTPQDRAQFEAAMFTFVPLCPPPIELCG